MVRETNGLLIYLLREYRHQMGNKRKGMIPDDKLQLQKRRLRRRRPTTRWKKCNPVRKKKTQL